MNRKKILRDWETLKRETRELIDSKLWARGAERLPEHYGYNPRNHLGSNAGRKRK